MSVDEMSTDELEAILRKAKPLPVSWPEVPYHWRVQCDHGAGLLVDPVDESDPPHIARYPFTRDRREIVVIESGVKMLYAIFAGTCPDCGQEYAYRAFCRVVSAPASRRYW